MSQGSRPGEWSVHFRRNSRDYLVVEGPVNVGTVTRTLERRGQRPLRPGTPFLLGPDGHPDQLINDYFTVGPGAALKGATPRTYAYRICSSLNALGAWGVSWREATRQDMEDLRVWRVFDENNPRRVEETTWSKQSETLRGLYRYAASRIDLASPMPDGLPGSALGGSYTSAAVVKWFDPAAYELWRDVGLAGLLPDGSESPGFRGSNTQRDAAFAGVLYRTGLRVQEAGTVLAEVEWPSAIPGRRFVRLRLASACAKMQRPRDYWVPRTVLSEVDAYRMGERSAVIARSQERYRAVADRLVILGTNDRAVTLRDLQGTVMMRPVQSLTPAERRRLYWDRDGALEPAALWLNDDGLPRRHTGWNKTFTRANERIERLGVDLSRLTPHMLRHSFALRWFIVARLLWQRRVAFLTEEETVDLRAELGSHWALVQTMLGHADPNTTMKTYLEPFQTLDIDLLLDHAADESVADLMSGVLRTHPRVQTVDGS